MPVKTEQSVARDTHKKASEAVDEAFVRMIIARALKRYHLYTAHTAECAAKGILPVADTFSKWIKVTHGTTLVNLTDLAKFYEIVELSVYGRSMQRWDALLPRVNNALADEGIGAPPIEFSTDKRISFITE